MHHQKWQVIQPVSLLDFSIFLNSRNYIYIYIYIYSNIYFIYFTIYIPICLPVCQSGGLTASLSASLSAGLSAGLSVCLFTGMSVSLSASLPAGMSACLSLYLSHISPSCLSVCRMKSFFPFLPFFLSFHLHTSFSSSSTNLMVGFQNKISSEI